MTAQEIYEAEGFLIVCHPSPRLLGPGTVIDNSTGGEGFSIEDHTPVVVKAEANLAEVHEYFGKYNPKCIPFLRGFARFYKVVAE